MPSRPPSVVGAGRQVPSGVARATRVAVAAKVREGNGLLRGARRGTEWMPFYGRDRLSDAEVADIAAFVGTIARE